MSSMHEYGDRPCSASGSSVALHLILAESEEGPSRCGPLVPGLMMESSAPDDQYKYMHRCSWVPKMEGGARPWPTHNSNHCSADIGKIVSLHQVCTVSIDQIIYDEEAARPQPRGLVLPQSLVLPWSLKQPDRHGVFDPNCPDQPTSFHFRVISLVR